MASTTSIASSTSAQTIVPQGEKGGASIRNTDANALYLLIGPGSTVSAINHTVALSSGDYFETPAFYNGEAITGIWAADGSGAALVTEF